MDASWRGKRVDMIKFFTCFEFERECKVLCFVDIARKKSVLI